ncbi:hypothetical protein CAPTEDRAFT_89696 [Capitella teleta]|uniref:G-protein coupled receptors family 1 profile domain-containing protein n=1 Tax=Capitella teleta TaxID=283909 RepID=R7T768_CAPTE|nr:hypothetical protein CAPTEDRAFT_89696 [Capitella teleta]|eukprot:ELT87230.1 hypothetical protein CAPTEDRAFT_89696 [Capitella teleta]
MPLNASLEITDVSRGTKNILTVLHCIVITFAVVGNIGVIVVFAKNKSFRGAVTIPILSLAIGNLLMALLCLPFSLILVLSRSLEMNSFSEFVCKLVPYMETTTIVSNALTMGGIAMERYFATLHPLKSRSIQSTTKTVLILTTIWMVAVCLAIPNLLWHSLEPILSADILNGPYQGFCSPSNHTAMTVYRLLILVGIFGLSFIAITVAYVQINRHLNKRKSPGNSQCPVELLHMKTSRRVISMLVAVQVLFFICWAPFLLFQAIAPVLKLEITPGNLNLYYFLHWWAACNCCQNPIVYTLLHPKFRRNFLSLCSCCCKQTKVRPIESSTSDSPPTSDRDTVTKFVTSLAASTN